MSTIVSVAVHAEHTQLPLVFAELVARLNTRAEWDVGIVSRHYRKDISKIERHNLQPQLLSLVESILPEDRALEIDMSYTLLSERQINISVHFYGDKYAVGYSVLYDSHININFSYNRLYDPLSRYPLGKGYLIEAERAKIADMILGDAEYLFFQVCDLLEGSGPNKILHGAMYLEQGWPSPAGSSMLYHRDIEEFTHDFARIYLQYHYGLLMAPSYGYDLWSWMDSELPEQKDSRFFDTPGKENIIFYKHFYRPNMERDVLSFLKNLTKESIRPMQRLPRQDILSLLGLVNAEQTLVRYHNFGAAGVVLSNRPRDSVWRAYDQMLENAKILL